MSFKLNGLLCLVVSQLLTPSTTNCPVPQCLPTTPSLLPRTQLHFSTLGGYARVKMSLPITSVRLALCRCSVGGLTSSRASTHLHPGAAMTVPLQHGCVLFPFLPSHQHSLLQGLWFTHSLNVLSANAGFWVKLGLHIHNIKLTIFTIVNAQFGGIKYIHTVAQHHPSPPPSSSRNFPTVPSGNSVPYKHQTPPSPAPGSHHLLFVSMNLTPLGILYKWNHTIFVLL